MYITYHNVTKQAKRPLDVSSNPLSLLRFVFIDRSGHHNHGSVHPSALDEHPTKMTLGQMRRWITGMYAYSLHTNSFDSQNDTIQVSRSYGA